MEDDVVLRVENLSKKFCRTLKRSIIYGTLDIARSMLGLQCKTWELRKDEFWALDDISFDLHKGETLGIIGVNGSGKSTLLRLITGIFPPDKGKIYHKGRVGALIAVGAGFHPHMTGRENIYLNGTILGMTRKEIDAKLDEIIDFADIGDFLEAPVNTYSSGMRVRLGFSIAVHCEPDILLVDEVLSVGDLAFRNKSLRKMNEHRKKANAIIFISHNLDQIRVLCDRVIILDYGKLVFDGDTDEGLIMYENRSKDLRVGSSLPHHLNNISFRERRIDGDAATIQALGLVNEYSEKVNHIKVDEPLIVFIDFIINYVCESLYFTLGILNERKDTDCIWVKSNDKSKVCFNSLKPGKYRLLVAFYEHHLGPGVYYINYSIRNEKSGELYEHCRTNHSFSVKSDKHYERGIVFTDDSWMLISLNE